MDIRVFQLRLRGKDHQQRNRLLEESEQIGQEPIQLQKAPALCLQGLPFLLVWCASLVAGSRRLAIVIILSRYLLLLQKIDWWEPKTIDSLFPPTHHKENQYIPGRIHD